MNKIGMVMSVFSVLGILIFFCCQDSSVAKNIPVESNNASEVKIELDSKQIEEVVKIENVNIPELDILTEVKTRGEMDGIPDTLEKMNEYKDGNATESNHVIQPSNEKSDEGLMQSNDDTMLVSYDSERLFLEAVEHESFDKMCQKYISASGSVNYSSWKNEEDVLDEYLSSLASSTPSSDWSKNRKLAYWINVYNAYTIKLILKNYPVKSIRDLDGGDPWKVEWILLDGKEYSLNNIEHDIIRPGFNEPRIHFAVNCAAKSCPPIQNFAFTEENINGKLDQATVSFINNSELNEISAKSANLSKIFEWYGSDFGDLISYINKYSKIKLSKNAEVKFMEYDWSLNGN